MSYPFPLLDGRCRLSPLSRRLDDGAFSASVSIRRGQGSASTDRVVRLAPRFDSEGDAMAYARQQATTWISEALQQTPAVAQ